MFIVLDKGGPEGTHLNIIKAIYENPIANIILSREQRQDYCLYPLPFNAVLEVLAEAERQE